MTFPEFASCFWAHCIIHKNAAHIFTYTGSPTLHSPIQIFPLHSACSLHVSDIYSKGQIAFYLSMPPFINLSSVTIRVFIWFASIFSCDDKRSRYYLSYLPMPFALTMLYSITLIDWVHNKASETHEMIKIIIIKEKRLHHRTSC